MRDRQRHERRHDGRGFEQSGRAAACERRVVGVQAHRRVTPCERAMCLTCLRALRIIAALFRRLISSRRPAEHSLGQHPVSKEARSSGHQTPRAQRRVALARAQRRSAGDEGRRGRRQGSRQSELQGRRAPRSIAWPPRASCGRIAPRTTRASSTPSYAPCPDGSRRLVAALFRALLPRYDITSCTRRFVPSAASALMP